MKKGTYKRNIVQHSAMGYNWSCTVCGMSSGRKFSVKRHVRNLHLDNGGIIPFVDYVSGRRYGRYPAQETNQMSDKSERNAVTRKTGSMHFENLMKKVFVEMENDMARKIANAINGPANDPQYRLIANQIRNNILQEDQLNTINDFLKEFQALYRNNHS